MPVELPRWEIIHGDCLEVLSGLPDCSFDSLVTDPPAGISFQGRKWDSNHGGRDKWIDWLASVMSECLRVLKPGAHAVVWSNLAANGTGCLNIDDCRVPHASADDFAAHAAQTEAIRVRGGQMENCPVALMEAQSSGERHRQRTFCFDCESSAEIYGDSDHATDKYFRFGERMTEKDREAEENAAALHELLYKHGLADCHYNSTTTEYRTKLKFVAIDINAAYNRGLSVEDTLWDFIE